MAEIYLYIYIYFLPKVSMIHPEQLKIVRAFSFKFELFSKENGNAIYVDTGVRTNVNSQWINQNDNPRELWQSFCNNRAQ